MKKILNKYVLISIALFLFIPWVFAAGGMPWEGPLEKVVDSLTGPVAKMVGVVIIVIAGLGIAMGEAGSGVRKLFQVVLGLGIAFSAASIITSVFHTSGGM
ncbi:MAG: TrbC/VirB2 family protein [Endozoicomonadaceae bacterium]|nr:TrbC/VirB2 family protein [Endozoicomonadaceae bacterium]